MKKLIIGWSIYLLGCVVAYPCIKSAVLADPKRSKDQVWSVHDRGICLLFCPLSWVSVAAGVVATFVQSLSSHEPANW